LHPSNLAASVGVASVENNTEAMLPVITVKISGKNSTIDTNKGVFYSTLEHK
jgi:hypothetical protein